MPEKYRQTPYTDLPPVMRDRIDETPFAPLGSGMLTPWTAVSIDRGVHHAIDGNFFRYAAMFNIGDGVLTSDSAVLESPSGRFTDALIGLALTDDGGIPAGTTVLSVESPNSLTMSQAWGHASATGRDVGIGDQFIFDGETINRSPTLASPGAGFTVALVGVPLSDALRNANIPAGTTVLSVESPTALTMSQDATGDGTGDLVNFGATVRLPAPRPGARVGAIFGCSEVELGSQFCGPLLVVPSSGLIDGAGSLLLDAVGDAAVLRANGTNWTTVVDPAAGDLDGSFPNPMIRSIGGVAVNLKRASSGQALIQQEDGSFAPDGQPLILAGSLPPSTPLPTSPVPGAPIYWSQAANAGQGGWVQDAIVVLNVEFHSSTDAGDIIGVVSQVLKASWIGSFKPSVQPDQQPSIFGYVDHLPAEGHAGLQLGYDGDSAAPPFNVSFGALGRSTYGVIRLDGTASCVVTAKDATISTSLVEGTYNADSTLMDWAGAAIIGTDLTADATNHWIHSAAGGLVFIFSTLSISPVQDDFTGAFN